MPKMRFAGTLSLFALVVSAMPAYAGFEWIAPANTQAAPIMPNSVYVAPPPPPVSTANSSNDIVSPVVITGTPSRNTRSYAPATDSVPISSAPVYEPVLQPAEPAARAPSAFPVQSDNRPDLATETISTAPVLTATAAPTPILSPSSPPSSDGVVQGFASQVPLTLALRQLLPVGDSFAIDQDVDANALVSFKGGKGWRETLADMLSPVALVFHESDHAIVISRAAAPTPSLSSVSPLPSPVNVKPSYLALPLSMQHQQGNAVALQGSDMRAAADWSAERGQTLRKVLEEWCGHSNVELQWLAEYDYPIEASAHFSGNFEDAVRNILSGFDGARPQPIGELHTNQSAGQMVLVVTTRGNSYSN